MAFTGLWATGAWYVSLYRKWARTMLIAMAGGSWILGILAAGRFEIIGTNIAILVILLFVPSAEAPFKPSHFQSTTPPKPKP